MKTSSFSLSSHRSLNLLLTLGVVGIMALSALSARAEWVTGVGVSYVETVFRPNYSFMSDRADKEYENKAYGIQADLVGGYRFRPTPKIAVGVGGSLGLADTRWSLRTSDAHLVYDIPFTAFVVLEPSVQLLDHVRLFGELGGGGGVIKESKSSQEASRYDVDEWVWGYRLGAGIGYEFGDDWEVALAFRRTTYDEVSYKSHLPDGTHWESISDRPYSDTVSVGVTRLW
jgi:opacity protein-like surface antigen